MSNPDSPTNTTGRGESDNPLVLVVLPRIVDLVIQQDRSLTPTFFSQRRKSYAIARDVLLDIVDIDELGLQMEDIPALPNEIVLVSQAHQRRLISFRGGVDPRLRTWRLAFEALAVARLEAKAAAEELSAQVVHDRIGALGRGAFSEIESVLRRESRLFEEDGLTRVYIEFVVMHADLTSFAPQARDTFFPSLHGRHRQIVDMCYGELQCSNLLCCVQPEGFELHQAVVEDHEAQAAEDRDLVQEVHALKPNAKRHDSLLRWAQAAEDGGNAVVSSMLYRRAGRVAPEPALAKDAEERSRVVIDSLLQRLQRALGFDDRQAERWSELLLDLFHQSFRGFWNTNKRLLYDLQKVCVDFERDSYSVNLWGFLRSFGRRPIQRAMPNQREVLMSKHLRNATARVAKARISTARREQLHQLLRSAADSAEFQLRRRLRRRIARALSDYGIPVELPRSAKSAPAEEAPQKEGLAGRWQRIKQVIAQLQFRGRKNIRRKLHENGLRPANVPEKVARDKLVEELLDYVVRRGYFTMGDVRDAISRSQLKLGDLAAPELWFGDAILRTNRRLKRLLEGVYRPGEFYLRIMQVLSSVGFGHPAGRFCVKYLAVPYGGAFVILKAIAIVLKKFDNHFLESSWLVSPSWMDVLNLPVAWHFELLPTMIPSVLVVGTLLIGLLYAERIRHVVWSFVQSVLNAVKLVVFDFPRWAMGLEWARLFLRSSISKAIRRYVITPLLPAALFYGLLSIFFGSSLNGYAALGAFMAIFTALDFFLNSSFGREVEKTVGAWISRGWYQLRVQVIRSLFDAVMTAFRQFVEAVERVLYAIDEWLLFKHGENQITFWLKVIVGSIWAVVAYGLRFCINLLVEPQINPIKHFPVVTVAHKVMLTSQPMLVKALVPALGFAMAQTVAGVILFITPGIFGFLVWELKSNWKLYQANRDLRLKPVPVGSHGETVARLLKPGFHSGTVPKLFGKMRQAERQHTSLRLRQILAQHRDRLHHHEVSVKHYVEREMLALLKAAPAFENRKMAVSDVELLPNSIRVRLIDGTADSKLDPFEITFRSESVWLVVMVSNFGWLQRVDSDQQAVIGLALGGLYQLSGVEVVQEQITNAIGLPDLFYHLNESSIDLWTGQQRELSVNYPLRSWGTVRPHPSALASSLGFLTLNPKQLLFSENSIAWDEWVHFWNSHDALVMDQQVIGPNIRLLPQSAASLT